MRQLVVELVCESRFFEHALLLGKTRVHMAFLKNRKDNHVRKHILYDILCSKPE